jgi:predicted small lipoprotein YifL
MRRLLRTPLLLVLLLALAACSASRGPRYVSEEDRSTVRVENRSWSDVVIYAVRSSQRIRLGSVPGVSTRTFTIPQSLVGGGIPIRFQADPIGSRRAPVTQEFTVQPGEEVEMYIPPS